GGDHGKDHADFARVCADAASPEDMLADDVLADDMFADDMASQDTPSRSSKAESFAASASQIFEPTCRSIAAEYAVHILRCNSRPFSVISTTRPRLSASQTLRTTSPLVTRRSISR